MEWLHKHKTVVQSLIFFLLVALPVFLYAAARFNNTFWTLALLGLVFLSHSLAVLTR